MAVGKNFQEAFLYTDLLEEAVHCQFLKEGAAAAQSGEPVPRQSKNGQVTASTSMTEKHPLFSQEHMTALVESANGDAEFRQYGGETGLSTSLTLHMEESNASWTVKFVNGEIVALEQKDAGEFMISGKAEWWNAVFQNRIDAFLATQQGKLKLKRGELAQLSRWYKPFQRAFAIWQTIAIQ